LSRGNGLNAHVASTDAFYNVALNRGEPGSRYAAVLGDGGAVAVGTYNHGNQVVNMTYGESAQVRLLDRSLPAYRFQIAHQEAQSGVATRDRTHGCILDSGHERSDRSTRNDQALEADLCMRHRRWFRMQK
jgi:hypothetical protein